METRVNATGTKTHDQEDLALAGIMTSRRFSATRGLVALMETLTDASKRHHTEPRVDTGKQGLESTIPVC